MGDQKSPEEGDRPGGERGLLHLWRGYSGDVTPERVLLSRPVLQASLGACHGLLLAEGGLVFSWGELPWRRGLKVAPDTPLLEDALTGRRVVSVAAGSFHSGALTEEGAVYMWGENSSGQCGVSETRGLVPEPSAVSAVDPESVPPQPVKVTELACGGQHTLALSAQSEVWAWGSGCQLGLVTSTFPVWRPQKVEHLAGRHVVQLACGAFHSLALVRSSHPPKEDYTTHKSSDQCGQCRQPLYSMTDQDDHVIISDGHYCPLGVELAAAAAAPGKCSRLVTPAQRPTACPASPDPGPDPGPAQDPDLVPDTHSGPDSDSDSGCAHLSFPVPLWVPGEPSLSRSGSPEPRSRGAVSPASQEEDGAGSPPAARSAGEWQGFLRRLSDPSLAEQTDPPSPAGELLSTQCLSSSYDEASSVRSPSHLAAPGLRGAQSSSLNDVMQQEAGEASRRRSLPGELHHESPVLSRRRGRPRRSGAAGPGAEAGERLPCLDTEVWSWGRGQEGQLGHGDYLPRLQPLCIKRLNGEEVIRLAAGSHHSLALTAQCQVFTWGSNMSGQLGHMTSPTTQPQQAQLSEGMRVWDVAAGQSHSLFLADGDCLQPVLCYSGQQDTHGSSEGSSQRSSKRSSPGSQTYTVRPTLLPFCIDMGFLNSVFGGGRSCVALADHNVMGFIAGIHELAASERKFYCQLANIKRRVVQPLLNRESVCAVLGQTSSQLFQTLVDSFSRLCRLAGQHSVSLTSFLRHTQDRDITHLLLLQNAAIFLDTFTEYCGSVGNFQVMGGFQSLMKLSVQCFGKHLEEVRQMSESSQQVPLEELLLTLCLTPLDQLHQYGRTLLKLATCFHVSTEAYQRLQEGGSRFEALSLGLGRRRKEAEATCLFWKTFSGKTTDSLRLPQRRLVCESSNKALTLQHAGRFSLHWFILFNDALVHAQFSSHHVYPLATLWVEPITKETSGLFGIKVTAPEETFTLLASSPQEKAKWLRALNQAVQQHVVGGAGVGVGGSPAASRSACYTFTREGRLKDASYSGRWLAGKPHGRGTLKWPDGTSYTGTFKNGLEDGYGECVIPNKLLSRSDRYLGHWRDGKMHGFGTYWYASGEVYEGSFLENARHGHGMLSSGKLDRSSSSVFVGQWQQDKRTGYGVFDDITKGEKYMGQWLEDHRQGDGVVVTQFGLYYEGAFSNNKMTGTGLLVAEDDTTFQGEFSEDWTPNGKGVLCLPNGDHIQGLFSGEWTAGLKIVGTYTKPNLYLPEITETPRKHEVGVLAVPAEQKWSCVFEECWSRLGCESPGQGDQSTAWDNIAVSLTTGRTHSPQLSRIKSRTLETLEVIPHHVSPVTAASYHNIRRYLSKACDTPLHPLGWLLETLVTVYRMTYVGVGSHRNLLRQAVGDIQSFLTRIALLVRFLFPDLPTEGEFIPDISSSAENCQQGWVVSSSSLLLPVLLPRLYPPLFTLYCLSLERAELTYWSCVLCLNKQPDRALLAYLGVQQRFWPKSVSVLGEEKQVLSSTKEACFASAVETLQQISTTFTPSDKLQVIHRTFQELTQEVEAQLDGDFRWSMDDLFPLFLYVVVRARIRNLGSEVSLIEDLMEPSLQHGELGLMFTTLQACYFQIQQEKTS